MYSWWRNYGGGPEKKLLILAAYNENSNLVGLAPLYMLRYHKKWIFRDIDSVQFLGTGILGEVGLRTDYLQFVVDKKNSIKTINRLIEFLCKNFKFDEIYFSNIAVDSDTYRVLETSAEAYRYYKRVQSRDAAYEVDCEADFSEYLSSIGRNTRLRLFNRRKILEKSRRCFDICL